MSIFASRSTSDPIPIPGVDPPATCTVRKLSGRELDTAQGDHLRATIAGRFAAHGWAAVFQRQLKAGLATDADAQHVLDDPLSGYDRHAIVKAGLLAWTITDPALPAPAADTSDDTTRAKTAAARGTVIEDLDDDALEFFAVAIMRRTKPGLFLTVDEAEQARKNAPGPSSSV
jgi:hypothetical protein